MIRTLKRLGFALVGVFIACVAYAQFSPAPSDIHINGHTYTAAQWQANPLGTLAAIANDVNAITQLYPSGRFSPRVKLTTDLAMYVDPAGNDLTTCLVGSPCQSLQRAYNVARDGYDLGGYGIHVHLACGSYTIAGLYASQQLLGQTLPGQLTFSGCNSANPSQTIISGFQVVPGDIYSIMEAAYSASFEVDSLTLIGSPGESLYAFRGGVIEYDNIVFGSASSCHTTASQGGKIITSTHHEISGPAFGHYCAYLGGLNVGCPVNTSCSVTIDSGAVFFTGAFAYAHNLGNVFAPNITFSGPSILGERYDVSSNAMISTGNAGASYFPGSIAGVSGTAGGQYR